MRWRGLLCCADYILRPVFVSIIAMFLFGTPFLNWSKEMWFFLYWHLKTNWYERFETCCDSINSRKYCLTMKTSNNKLWLHQLALGLEIWKSSQMAPSILRKSTKCEFWVVYRSERTVLSIFPLYIMSNKTKFTIPSLSVIL